MLGHAKVMTIEAYAFKSLGLIFLAGIFRKSITILASASETNIDSSYFAHTCLQ